jgi:hypothetical protein
VDVLTGDQQSNVYRGYFGRRFQTGLGIQFGFQQFSTESRNIGGDGNALGLFGRLGWARGAWSLDASLHRESRDRTRTLRIDQSPALPPLEGTRSNALVRFAFRSPETDNFWSQLILASTSYAERTAFSAASAPFAADSADTTTTRPQYVLMTGGRVGGLRTTVAARYRRFDSEDFVSPSVRAEWGAGALLVSGSFERTAEDSLTRADAGARYTVGSRLALAGQLSRRGSFSDSAPDAQQFVRADASVRLGSWWFSGGYC